MERARRAAVRRLAHYGLVVFATATSAGAGAGTFPPAVVLLSFVVLQALAALVVWGCGAWGGGIGKALGAVALASTGFAGVAALGAALGAQAGNASVVSIAAGAASALGALLVIDLATDS